MGYHFDYLGMGYDDKLSKIPGNEHRQNLILESNLVSAGRSEIYYNWWGRLKLYPTYHIILDSVSDHRTRIIIASEPKVKTGLGLDTNHGIPYVSAHITKVKPSTIEEYEIIQLIGEVLNQKGMPNIIRPN